MSGVQFATETYRTGFQKKDHGEDCESRRKSYLFSKVFVTNLQVRLDFSSMSPKFPFFFVIPTEPSIRTHRWCAEGRVEAPGSKVLPQWTLNSRVYAHTCTQTKEI